MRRLRWSVAALLLPALFAGCGGKGGGGAGGSGGSGQPVKERAGCLREHHSLKQQTFAWQAGVVEAFAYASRDCGSTLEEVMAVAGEQER